ncbi:ImmA/IrrE family metallo-endopeptidase [Sideroxydans sp.]
MATTDDKSKITVTSALSCVASNQEFRQRNSNYPLSSPVPIRSIKANKPGWAQGLNILATLLDAVQSIISKPVEIELFDDTTAPNIDGMCSEFEDKAIVFVNKKHNYCWARFFVAKELAHLLMNHKLDMLRTVDAEIIVNTITGLLNPHDLRDDSIYLQSEFEAYMGAVEMLLSKDSLDKFSGVANPDEHISQAMKIPKRIVAMRITDKVSAMHDQIYAHPLFDVAIVRERVNRAGR